MCYTMYNRLEREEERDYTYRGRGGDFVAGGVVLVFRSGRILDLFGFLGSSFLECSRLFDEFCKGCYAFLGPK